MSTLAANAPPSHTRALVLVWAVLVGLTVVSWWFSDHGLGPAMAAILILVLTFIKVFMVGNSFMELRTAPRVMKAIFTAWCVGICAVLVGLAVGF